MPTVMPNTPNALVGGGVANTDFDDFTNPVASDALNSSSVPHALQHSNVNDALERVERYVIARGPRVSTIANINRTGAITTEQALMNWTIPGVVGTGWMTTRTVIHVKAWGTLDNSTAGNAYTMKLRVGTVAQYPTAGATLSTFTKTVANTTTLPLVSTGVYAWEWTSDIVVTDITTPSAVLLRTGSYLTTDWSETSTAGNGPGSGSATHPYIPHLEHSNGVAYLVDNTQTAVLGLTCIVPATGTAANNIVHQLAGFISLESI